MDEGDALAVDSVFFDSDLTRERIGNSGKGSIDLSTVDNANAPACLLQGRNGCGHRSEISISEGPHARTV